MACYITVRRTPFYEIHYTASWKTQHERTFSEKIFNRTVMISTPITKHACTILQHNHLAHYGICSTGRLFTPSQYESGLNPDNQRHNSRLRQKPAIHVTNSGSEKQKGVSLWIISSVVKLHWHTSASQIQNSLTRSPVKDRFTCEIQMHAIVGLRSGLTDFLRILGHHVA